MIRSKKFRSASDILSQQNNAEAQNLDKSKSLQPRALTQRNGTPPEKVNNIMLQSQRLSNISPFFFLRTQLKMIVYHLNPTATLPVKTQFCP
jgi:hypothetical protein